MDLELAVSQAVSQSRLLERLLHDAGPWYAIVYGKHAEYRVPLERTILAGSQSIVLAGYAGPGCHGASRAEIYCGMALATIVDFPPANGPFRLVIERAIEVVAA